MIALRALRLTLIVFVLLCIVMTLMAVLLGTGHPQTTLTPGVVSPTPSSPTGLPEGPTFSTCSYACNSQYLACVNPCSTAAGIAAGTPSNTSGIGGGAPTPFSTSVCFSNCTNLRQTCTLGCSGLPFD
jgi:nitrate/nitrite transporter NarK